MTTTSDELLIGGRGCAAASLPWLLMLLAVLGARGSGGAAEVVLSPTVLVAC